MDKFVYEDWEDSLYQSLRDTLSPFLESKIDLCDECDFFPGQRFFSEFFSPAQVILFMELSLPMKQKITESVFKQKWENIENSIKDDCFLEILNIISRKNIRYLYQSEHVRFRYSSPRVIFDEYEDDLEVSTLDMYRFDFRMDDAPFALIVGVPPGPYLIPPNNCN